MIRSAHQPNRTIVTATKPIVSPAANSNAFKVMSIDSN